jgi:hypothetical protein
MNCSENTIMNLVNAGFVSKGGTTTLLRWDFFIVGLLNGAPIASVEDLISF